MKICVYAICKNEEKFVERWFNSAKDADGIFVRLLKKEGYKIYTEENYPGKL